jgi:hypothetical protein
MLALVVNENGKAFFIESKKSNQQLSKYIKIKNQKYKKIRYQYVDRQADHEEFYFYVHLKIDVPLAINVVEDIMKIFKIRERSL